MGTTNPPETKIQENFSSSKAITYLITSTTGELANDLQTFLRKKEMVELVITHHDKVHGKTWEAEYNIKRIDEWIAEKEKREGKFKNKEGQITKIIKIN